MQMVYGDGDGTLFQRPVVDTASLPPAVAAAIERLVPARNVPAAVAPAAPAQPDRFSYALTVSHDNGAATTHTFDEASATPDLTALISALQAAAKK